MLITYYFAQFRSPMYPEDNEIFEPGYPTEEEALQRIERELSYASERDPEYPEMYQKKRRCYSILSLEIRTEGDEDDY